MSEERGYGRHEQYSKGEFVLIAESLRASKQDDETMANVWKTFVWSALTLYCTCHHTGEGFIPKPLEKGVSLEWHLLSRIMRAWGYNPGVKQYCHDFDEDCKAAHRRVYGNPYLSMDELTEGPRRG